MLQKVNSGQKINFTIDSIQNPSTIGMSYSVLFEILSSSGLALESGTYNITNLITKGMISQFTVSPRSLIIGDNPVSYDFVI